MPAPLHVGELRLSLLQGGGRWFETTSAHHSVCAGQGPFSRLGDASKWRCLLRQIPHRFRGKSDRALAHAFGQRSVPVGSVA
jgi:hypothetical protein